MRETRTYDRSPSNNISSIDLSCIARTNSFASSTRDPYRRHRISSHQFDDALKRSSNDEDFCPGLPNGADVGRSGAQEHLEGLLDVTGICTCPNRRCQSWNASNPLVDEFSYNRRGMFDCQQKTAENFRKGSAILRLQDGGILKFKFSTVKRRSMAFGAYLL